MQQYINQLVEDLDEKSQTKIEAPDYTLLNPDHPAIEYGLDYLVAWECAPDLTYSEVFEIPNEAFPPAKMLNDKQAKQVFDAIVNLLRVNNIELSLPECLPSFLVLYRELRREWKEGSIRIMPDDDGRTHIDFCHYNGKTCPWGMDFCTCKDEDWYNEDYDIDNFSTNDEDLPF
ncbi:hypothetical protein WAF17_01095 [Bernardetia sp. ABR2-2B]|uniref:hypothetical protein n=1 Tax=Bernardetia sp. ABR2-2B TaxID=3127472 RepID=UPI0030D516DC